jgi:hypothetical protein
MDNAISQTGWRSLELGTVRVGLALAGFAVAVTTVSYAANMEFAYQWLVWMVAAAFAVVALLSIEWQRALGRGGEIPAGKLRKVLIFSIPLAFVVSSQVCGLGLRGCNAVCHATNLSLIGIGVVSAVRLHRNQPIGTLLIPMVAISLVPHCVCHAPINTLWHRALNGVAPTCEMVPLAAVLFAVAALRGVRPRAGTVMVVAMFGVMAFIVVGGLLFGFPWEGCVDHSMIASAALNEGAGTLKAMSCH